MVRDIMNSMFVIDGAPVKPLLSKILPQVRKIGFLNILLDVRGALKAL
jgi:electron transfer flavoprotein-quinone oxidoreductase